MGLADQFKEKADQLKEKMGDTKGAAQEKSKEAGDRSKDTERGGGQDMKDKAKDRTQRPDNH